jgi:N-acetylglucosaminyl-diphospho-decaprenol L-rhamnosyltransferase
LEHLDDLAFGKLCTSIVSHGHGAEVFQLISTLDALCFETVRHVVLTINIPEPDLLGLINAGDWKFRLSVIQNSEPKGFGANHNSAFLKCDCKYFCVLNPDIILGGNPFPALISQFGDERVGCSFPVQLAESGELQDYARKRPSPLALLSRYAGSGMRHKTPSRPEWVNGAFMVFPAGIFQKLSGFDERYFMYCEDVDICLRLQNEGYRLGQSAVTVTHPAHRNSRVNFRHLAWHMASLLRLWTSGSYRKFVRLNGPLKSVDNE